MSSTSPPRVRRAALDPLASTLACLPAACLLLPTPLSNRRPAARSALRLTGRSFLRILHDSSEPVYIAFFTLTGLNLQLSALLPNLSTAVLIFSVRLVAMMIGSYYGGKLGGASEAHYSRYWMVFITQAGVTLGLAQQVGTAFASEGTGFGPTLALCFTAEVVLNQLIGTCRRNVAAQP